MSSSDGSLILLEELFPRSRKTLRVLAVLLRGGEYTKYGLEKAAAVSKIDGVLARLVEMGVVVRTGDAPPRYRLAEDTPYRRLLERLLLGDEPQPRESPPVPRRGRV